MEQPYPPAERFRPIRVASKGGHPTAVELDGAQLRVDRVLTSYQAHEHGFCSGGRAWCVRFQDGAHLWLWQDALRDQWYVRRER